MLGDPILYLRKYSLFFFRFKEALILLLEIVNQRDLRVPSVLIAQIRIAEFQNSRAVGIDEIDLCGFIKLSDPFSKICKGEMEFIADRENTVSALPAVHDTNHELRKVICGEKVHFRKRGFRNGYGFVGVKLFEKIIKEVLFIRSGIQIGNSNDLQVESVSARVKFAQLFVCGRRDRAVYAAFERGVKGGQIEELGVLLHDRGAFEHLAQFLCVAFLRGMKAETLGKEYDKIKFIRLKQLLHRLSAGAVFGRAVADYGDLALREGALDKGLVKILRIADEQNAV